MAKRHQRVLLKLSGEALCLEGGFGIDPNTLSSIGQEILDVVSQGVQLAIVIGGGNIFRGLKGASFGMDRSTADYMGMLATVLNSMALQDGLERQGCKTRVLSAIEMKELAEPYIRRRAIRHLEKNRVVIFAAGTGNPFFTTDTAASLRAMEIGAEVILKATRVDGVFDRDPEKHKDAVRYDKLTYIDVLQKGLKVMDSTATSLCMDHNLPIKVFNMTVAGNIFKACMGEDIGTLVTSDAKES